jgi:hypothetical protein
VAEVGPTVEAFPSAGRPSELGRRLSRQQSDCRQTEERHHTRWEIPGCAERCAKLPGQPLRKKELTCERNFGGLRHCAVPSGRSSLWPVPSLPLATTSCNQPRRTKS